MRVLLWDLRREGHHARWLSYLEDSAPDGIDVITSPPVLRPGPTLTPGREWRMLKGMMKREQPDAVILASGHTVARRLAVSPLLSRCPWLVLDLRCSMAVLARPDRFPKTNYRTRAGAIATYASREIAVRRGTIAFGYLIPWAAEVGSRKLRNRSRGIPDPREALDFRREDEPCGERLIASLVGVLTPRKGLDVLAAATRRAPDLSDRYAFRIAGNPASGYEEHARKTAADMRAAGFDVDLILRQLSTEEYEEVLSSTDVVLLPYVRHLGSSGILGAVLETGRHRAIVSDYGWLGEVAGSAGAVLFSDGDAESLAMALRQAAKSRAVGPAAAGFASISDFARLVWRLLPAAVGGHH